MTACRRHSRRHQHAPRRMRAVFLHDPNGHWFEINDQK